MERTRIAVIGVGAIGGAVAADLADLGRHDLVLCARTPFDRLEVEHPAGVSRVAARLVTRPEDVGPTPWVLLATKAYQCAAARPWLDALCGPETIVAVLQNGVDHLERVAPLLPPGTSVVPVVIQLAAQKTAPGRIRQDNDGWLIVPDDVPGRAFAGLFEGARATAKPVADFLSQAWWKLMANAALGGVCALAIREGGVASELDVRELVLTLMREAAQVGRAEEATLPDDAPERVLDRVLAAVPQHWPSIALDRREGRPMEWEVRNAVVGRLGRRHGVATPQNDAITTLLRAADGGRASATRPRDPASPETARGPEKRDFAGT